MPVSSAGVRCSLRMSPVLCHLSSGIVSHRMLFNVKRACSLDDNERCTCYGFRAQGDAMRLATVSHAKARDVRLAGIPMLGLLSVRPPLT